MDRASGRILMLQEFLQIPFERGYRGTRYGISGDLVPRSLHAG